MEKDYNRVMRTSDSSIHYVSDKIYNDSIMLEEYGFVRQPLPKKDANPLVIDPIKPEDDFEFEKFEEEDIEEIESVTETVSTTIGENTPTVEFETPVLENQTSPKRAYKKSK